MAFQSWPFRRSRKRMLWRRRIRLNRWSIGALQAAMHKLALTGSKTSCVCLELWSCDNGTQFQLSLSLFTRVPSWLVIVLRSEIGNDNFEKWNLRDNCFRIVRQADLCIHEALQLISIEIQTYGIWAELCWNKSLLISHRPLQYFKVTIMFWTVFVINWIVHALILLEK